MASITINGRRIAVGNSIQMMEVNGNEIYVNGKKINPSDYASDDKVINVVVEGNVESVSNESGDIRVSGDAGTVKTVSGDVQVSGAVQGAVSTVSGDVEARGGVGGAVSTVSGDVYRR